MGSTSKKVVIVGDADCGKTSLLTVFSKNDILKENTPITFQNKVFDIEVDGEKVSLCLYSVAGEKFERPARLHGGHV